MNVRDAYMRGRDDDEGLEQIRNGPPYLILDFQTYYLHDSPYSTRSSMNSLKAQYDRLITPGKKPATLTELLKDTIYGLNYQTEVRKVSIFNPSYERVEMKDSHGNTYINNIVIRLDFGSNKNYDLMLIGDIKMTNTRSDDQQRSFIVKGISLLDRSCSHYGQVNIDCRIICLIKESDGIGDSYLNSSGKELIFSKRMYRYYLYSALSNEKIAEIRNNYIVPDAGGVIDLISEWDHFLTDSEEKVGALDDKRFVISRMRF